MCSDVQPGPRRPVVPSRTGRRCRCPPARTRRRPGHAGHAGHGRAGRLLGRHRVGSAEEQTDDQCHQAPQHEHRVSKERGRERRAPVAGSGSTAGTMASARSTMSGPVFGSVPEPVKMPPRPWPLTQKKVANRPPAARNGVGRRNTRGPNPMTSEPMASSHVVHTPPLPKWLPKLLRKWE